MNDRTSSPVCLNCDAALAGEYCSRCGQQAVPERESVRDLLAQDVAELLAWDSRLALTLRRLLFDPAGLVRDWLAGRRATYVRPIRLYLAISALFLLVFGFLHPYRDPAYFELAIGALERRFGAVADERALFVERFIAWYNTIVPFVVALTIPATALVLRVLWRRVPLHDHLVLVIYVYCFWLIVGLLLRISSPLLGDALPAARIAFIAASLVYTGFALRGLYRDRWPLWALKYVLFVIVFLFIYDTAGRVAEGAAFLLAR